MLVRAASSRVAPGYEVAKPKGTAGSLLSMMELVGHAERRKIWDRAFTPSALKSYEPLLAARVAELLENLSARLGTEVDLAEWVR
jgi:cytochrome P450